MIRNSFFCENIYLENIQRFNNRFDLFKEDISRLVLRIFGFWIFLKKVKTSLWIFWVNARWPDRGTGAVLKWQIFQGVDQYGVDVITYPSNDKQDHWIYIDIIHILACWISPTLPTCSPTTSWSVVLPSSLPLHSENAQASSPFKNRRISIQKKFTQIFVCF